MRTHRLRFVMVLMLMIIGLTTGITQPAAAFSSAPAIVRHGLQQAGSLRATTPLVPASISSYNYLPSQSELSAALRQAGFSDAKLVSVDTEIPNGVDAFREYTVTTGSFGKAYLSLIATTLPSYVTATFYLQRLDRILAYDVDAPQMRDVADQVGLTQAQFYQLDYADNTTSHIYLMRQGMVVTGIEINGVTTDSGAYVPRKAALDTTRDLIVERQSSAPSVNSDLQYTEQNSDQGAAAQAWAQAVWQTSAPRTAAAVSDLSVQIGLRNKWGTPTDTANNPTLVQRGEVYEVGAVVTEPSGWTAAAYGLLVGNDWLYAQYPYDFIGGRDVGSGTYTITWYEFNGKGESTVLAKDSFSVR